MMRLVKIPVLVGLDGGEGVGFKDIGFGDLSGKRRTRINRWVIKKASAVTVLTWFQRNSVVSNLGIKREFKVIPRGVDEGNFNYTQKSLSYPLVFLNVAYLSPIKNPELLLKTFDFVRKRINCVMIQIGADYMNGQVQAMAEKMGIGNSIEFKGHIPYDEVSKYYHKSDILLLTSKYESQGMVLAEALSTGTLVCGTHVGLMSDLSGQYCLTVSDNDFEKLGTAILELIKDEDRMNSMRRNGLEWSRRNSLSTNEVEFVNLYNQLILEG
jgi:glycosyltransferase involved in cell wall biosynthesis